MTRSATWLLEHRRDVYSQFGEDGIIEEILGRLPEKDQWCVEFGAWDGLHLSNTRNLIMSEGYSAVLIEGDRRRFEDLKRNCSERANVHTLNRFVGFQEQDNLDAILSDTPIPADFDFLSIDIDGNDYHVWAATSRVRPKVVAVEFNPTIPTDVQCVQAADPSVSQGASLSSLVELAKGKGYELVSVLPCNAFFVRREYFDAFEIASNTPDVLRTELGAVTYVFSGYDGRVFLSGRCQLPWHCVSLREARVQHLPFFLRTPPGNYTMLQKVLFGLHRLVREPRTLVKGMGRRIRRLKKWARRRAASAWRRAAGWRGTRGHS